VKLRCIASWGRPTWCQLFCLNYEAYKAPNFRKIGKSVAQLSVITI